LSFKEYLLFRSSLAQSEKSDNKKEFIRYLRLGGFPAIHIAEYTEENAYKIIYDIYSSIILRDTVLYATMGYRDRMIAGVLENIVCTSCI
jgi:predicted AAA+ superfamily ATPase